MSTIQILSKKPPSFSDPVELEKIDRRTDSILEQNFKPSHIAEIILQIDRNTRLPSIGMHTPQHDLPKISHYHPKIIAVLPAYNEEVAIGSMVLRAKKHVDEVIVVDDGSKDKTAQIARDAEAVVIRHPKNTGKGAALETGFKEACKRGADIIVTLDSDGQHNPDEVPLVIEPILKKEADMVNGSRYMNGNGRNTPFYRRLGQSVLDSITNLNSGLQLTDTQSGFRAFAVQSLPAFNFRSNGLAIESEMLADAANAGLKIKEVEIGVRYDVDCSTENPISHGLRVLVNVLHDMELNRPLYYFTFPGIVLAVVGIGMGLGFLQRFYYGGSLSFGPMLLMLMLTIVGAFMAFTGLILHAVSRMINESKKKH